MNGKLDVEVRDGRVIAVWLNCRQLPFEQVDVSPGREAQYGGRGNPDGAVILDVKVAYGNPPE